MPGIGKYEGVGDFDMNPPAPTQYAPFKMKASGAKYNNSPIEKNYGSPAHRGFADFTGGVGSKEMDGGVGTAFDYASPNKFMGGMFGAGGLGRRMIDRLRGGNKGPGATLADAGQAARDAIAQAKANEQVEGEAGVMPDAGGEGAEMAVPPHGDEAHTGGGGGVMTGGGKVIGKGGGGKFGRLGGMVG